MIKDITIGQYFHGNSFLHRLDARMKLIATVFILVVIFMCKSFPAIGICFLMAAVSVIVSRLSYKMLLKSLKPILIIIIFTTVLNIFYTKGGTVLFHYRFLTITDKGIYTAIFIASRIILLIVISSLLTYTTTPTSLTNAIEQLLSPLKKIKIPVHTFAMMMTLALRFIPTLIEETDRIMNAQKARGSDLESGGFIKRSKALIPVFIPLLVSSIHRAYELAFAMECRGYNGGIGKTSMKKMKFSYRDLVAFLIVLALLAGVIIMNHYFNAVI